MADPQIDGPGYWLYETSGVLRPAVEAYLHHQPLTAGQIAALRAYLRQWIAAPVCDHNPHADTQGHAWLAAMRGRIDGLTTRAAINAWLQDALDAGMDPL